MLSAEEAEARSQALIQKLLAEDAAVTYSAYDGFPAYGGKDDEDEYGYYDNNDDDDGEFGSTKRKSGQTKKGGARGRPRKQTNQQDGADFQMNEEEEEEYDADGNPKKKRKSTVGGPRKRKSMGQQPAVDEHGNAIINNPSESTTSSEDPTKVKKQKIRHPKPDHIITGPYSDEEEVKFLEALELYGRDWKKLAEHIGTRDPHSIRSHAQKHFIKLYRDGKSLPDKVKESGEGYTLSGKPLDPTSAAARPYLIGKKGTFDPTAFPIPVASTTTATTATAIPVAIPPAAEPVNLDSSGNSQEPAPKQKQQQDQQTQQAAEVNAAAPTQQAVNAEPVAQPQVVVKKPVASKQGAENVKRPPPEPVNPYKFEEVIPTDYALNRPRRNRKSVMPANLSSQTDPYTLIKPEPFAGPCGADVANAQPFSVVVEPVAMALMDLHAHLATTEIIGFLAGEWRANEKKLYVQSAFPTRSLEHTSMDPTHALGADRHLNVEMDPISEIEVRQKIKEKNLKVVGWYHSHPTFEPNPSLVDVENQQNYQRLFRVDECEGNIPVNVGYLAGEEPFVGAIVAPYDRRLPTSISAVNWFFVSNRVEDRGHPKQLVVEFSETAEILKSMGIPDDEVEKMVELVRGYAKFPDRSVFTENWKYPVEEDRLSKLIKSLKFRLNDEAMLWKSSRRKGATNQSEQGEQQNSQVTGQQVSGNEETNVSSLSSSSMENDQLAANSTKDAAAASQNIVQGGVKDGIADTGKEVEVGSNVVTGNGVSVARALELIAEEVVRW